jgi:peptidyl-tRNA hydrolase
MSYATINQFTKETKEWIENSLNQQWEEAGKMSIISRINKEGELEKVAQEFGCWDLLKKWKKE